MHVAYYPADRHFLSDTVAVMTDWRGTNSEWKSCTTLPTNRLTCRLTRAELRTFCGRSRKLDPLSNAPSLPPMQRGHSMTAPPTSKRLALHCTELQQLAACKIWAGKVSPSAATGPVPAVSNAHSAVNSLTRARTPPTACQSLSAACSGSCNRLTFANFDPASIRSLISTRSSLINVSRSQKLHSGTHKDATRPQRPPASHS